MICDEIEFLNFLFQEKIYQENKTKLFWLIKIIEIVFIFTLRF